MVWFYYFFEYDKLVIMLTNFEIKIFKDTSKRGKNRDAEFEHTCLMFRIRSRYGFDV